MSSLVQDLLNDEYFKSVILVFLDARDPEMVDSADLYSIVLNALDLDLVDTDNLQPYQAKALQMGLQEAKTDIYNNIEQIRSALMEHYLAHTDGTDYSMYASLDEFVRSRIKQ